MSNGTRPGGLTALAVLNFVFGGFGCLGALGLLMLLVGLNAVAPSNTQLEGSPFLHLILAFLLTAVTAGLLIASGVGYIKQSRSIGQTLGNIYGILGVIRVVYRLLILGAPFTLWTIVSLIYPALTLILLNTVFKEDFVNP